MTRNILLIIMLTLLLTPFGFLLGMQLGDSVSEAYTRQQTARIKVDGVMKSPWNPSEVLIDTRSGITVWNPANGQKHELSLPSLPEQSSTDDGEYFIKNPLLITDDRSALVEYAERVYALGNDFTFSFIKAQVGERIRDFHDGTLFVEHTARGSHVIDAVSMDQQFTRKTLTAYPPESTILGFTLLPGEYSNIAVLLLDNIEGKAEGAQRVVKSIYPFKDMRETYRYPKSTNFSSPNGRISVVHYQGKPLIFVSRPDADLIASDDLGETWKSSQESLMSWYVPFIFNGRNDTAIFGITGDGKLAFEYNGENNTWSNTPLTGPWGKIEKF